MRAPLRRSLLAAALGAGLVASAFAQGVTTSITTDGTVGPAETITAPPGSSTYTIPESLGSRPGGGDNLFQSFSIFNLGQGDIADFTATHPLTDPPKRVISRVTGGDASQIDGTMKSSIPGADFYFLNPAGVMFGEGASLDVTGSFHVSTAQELTMRTSGGAELLAFSGNAALATAAPSAFGFLGAAPAAITVKPGATLETPNGHGISLVGGTVQILSDQTPAPPSPLPTPPATRIEAGGRLLIASVRSTDDVAIIEHDDGLALAPDLSEPGGSSFDPAPDAGPASITLQGSRIDLFDADPAEPPETGEAPLADGTTLLSTAGGDIVLRAGTLRIDGARILSTAAAGAPGGDIRIEAGSVTLLNAARVEAIAAHSPPGGDPLQGGNVEIEAIPSGAIRSLTMSGQSVIDTDSFGNKPTDEFANHYEGGSVSGDVAVQGFEQVALSGQSQIRSDAYYGSRTGDVVITGADSTQLSERAEISSGSFSGSNKDLPQNVEPGGVTIESDSIELRSGGSIESISVRAGDGGDVNIRTRTLLAEGAFIDPDNLNLAQPSGVSSTIGFANTEFGDDPPFVGGDVVVHAEEIQLLNGGRIAAETIAVGQGGTVELIVDGPIIVSGVNAELAAALEEIGLGEVNPPPGSVGLQLGREEDFAHSAIATNSLVPTATGEPNEMPFGSGGPAGDIALHVNELELSDGGLVAAFTEGLGAGGAVTIDAAESVSLSGPSQITTDTNFASPGAQVGGTGGSIHIMAPELRLTGDAEISSDVGGGGSGAGGSVTIRAGMIELLQQDGEAPEISTDTEGSGAGGDLTLVASKSIRIDSPAGAEAGGIFANSKFAEDGAGGSGAAGSITLSAPEIHLKGGVIAASTEGSGVGGSITVGPDPADPSAPLPRRLRLSQGARISVESSGTGAAGNIDLKVAGKLELESGSSVTTEAAGASGGQIALAAHTFYAHDSSVTTSVATGSGNGGNVDVTADLVALNSAEIRANAEDGNGGNIQITAGNYIATPDSVLSASSNTGVDGVITITSPDVNVEAGLTQLQAQFAGASDLLRPSCAVRSGDAREGSFVVAKRRGVPNSPEDLLLAFDAVGGATGLAPTTGAEAQAQVAGAGGKAASVASLAAANAFRGGDLDQAEANYAEAAKLLAAGGGDAKEQGVALRGLAQTQQAAGRYAASLETLRGAVDLAEKSDDRAGLASALGGLGNAYVALGRGTEAAPLLERGIAIATESGDTVLAAGLWNNLGNQHATQAAWPEAGAAYEQAARLAATSGDPLAETKALGNAAHAALDAGQPERARALLTRAETRINALPTSAERAGLRIHAARVWANLAAAAPAYRREGLLSAHRLLTAALEESQALGAERARSYALGNLGGLYQSEALRDEGLFLTRQAIRSAEAADAPESLYRWYWQEAQLLRDQGDTPAALASYRRAIEVLEETREEAQGRYGAAAAYFRSAVAPVYLEMVDLLLTRAQSMPVASGVLLVEARSTVEQLKAAELRDYFRDECVAELAAKTTTLEEVSREAAVIYPIVLPERLELLVTLPSGLRRYAVPVSSRELSETVGRFRRALQDPASDAYRALGRQLYDWLVRPYAADLAESGVTTLVFVPDGPLRTVPMSALSDGEHYLAERYALAVTPSLALVDPHPLDRTDMHMLIGGVSESVEGFPALAMVPRELEAVSKRYGGEVLLDADFGLERVEQEIRESQPSVVHIASHAVFTGDPETSFVLLHDDKLTMERLSNVVGVTKFRERPLELLVLSACETAAGDERAGLGLAGVAIRAGARSAVGSLWPISDEAAFRLVDSFYEALGDPAVSKAQALQHAQAKLREDPRFAHPYFWSPFLIINNWL